jgi:hypothetical protein
MDFFLRRQWSRYRHLAISHIVVVLFVFAQIGCSKEKLAEIAAAAKDQAQSIQDKAAQVQQQARDVTASTPIPESLSSSGRTVIGLPSPVESSSGYFRFYKIGDGRSSIIQFTSYEPEKGPNTYPALLLRATTTAESPQMLAGQSLNADVYLQTTLDTAVMTNAENSTVTLGIAIPDPQSKNIKGQIGPMVLVDTDGTSTNVNQIIVEGRLP